MPTIDEVTTTPAEPIEAARVEADFDEDFGDETEEYESPAVHIRAAVCPTNCY